MMLMLRSGFFVLITWLVSPSGIFGTLLLPLMLLTTTAKKKPLFAFIRVELRAFLISGRPSQRAAFTADDLAKSKF